MQVQLRHNPSFTVARCLLAPGEPLLQSRNPEAFQQWVAAAVPGRTPREGIGGIAGGLFGG